MFEAAARNGYVAPGPCPDTTLMRRVAGGDADAFRELVERHTPMVFGLAWRMLADRAEAEDVVQESFTRIWVQAPNWSPSGGGLGGWLRRVATNLCLDRLRRARRSAGDDALPAIADEAPLADARFDAGRREAAVAAAIAALPANQRAAIVLTYHEGLSNADAALALGLRLKALESLPFEAPCGVVAAR